MRSNIEYKLLQCESNNDLRQIALAQLSYEYETHKKSMDDWMTNLNNGIRGVFIGYKKNISPQVYVAKSMPDLTNWKFTSSLPYFKYVG